MSLFVTSLNSGSNGNCYYVGNEKEAILIDAGICCSEIEKRMNRLLLNIKNVKGIFVSHEHTDHISGIQVLSNKYQLPVFITHTTLYNSRLELQKHLIHSFSAHQAITIGNLSITGFPKFHDAADPYSFVVTCNKIKIGVFTDIGTPCKNLVTHFKQCHAAFLESNYDEVMLEEGKYPYFLKNRIRGGNGHLSNTQALDLFTKNKSSFLSHIFLSHLSKNNNCPKLVQHLFTEHAAGVKIIIASRDKETPVYYISNVDNIQPKTHQHFGLQLTLAFT